MVRTAAAADVITDVDAAADRYDHPTCTEHQVLHTMTEASRAAGRCCCPDHALPAL